MSSFRMSSEGTTTTSSSISSDWVDLGAEKMDDLASFSSSSPTTSSSSAAVKEKRIIASAAAATVVAVKVEPIPMKATVKKVGGLSLFAADPKDAGETKGEDEYLLTLESQIDPCALPWLNRLKEEEVEFLVILDKSGSMAGRPWEQVKSAMIKMIEMTNSNPRIFIRIMVYNGEADFIKNSAADVMKLRAGGSTNFVAVFQKVQEVLLARTAHAEAKERGHAVKKLFRGSNSSLLKDKRRKLFIFFMTDGCDTCNGDLQILEARERLQDAIAKYREDVIVHVLGFSEHHDDAFLEALTLMGTADGSYSYIRPSDGDVALETRLTELLEATTGLVGKSVFLEMKLEDNSSNNGNNNNSNNSSNNRFLGDWFGPGSTEIVLQAFMHIKDDWALVQTTKFIRLSKNQDPSELKLTVNMLRDLRDDTESVPCLIHRVEVGRTPEQQLGRHETNALRMRKIRAGLNMLSARMGCAVDGSAAGGDEYARIMAEMEEWFGVVKKATEEAKIFVHHGEDLEVDSLCDAVAAGLRICGKAFEKEADETEMSMQKRVRSVNTSYNLSTNQMHNVLQVKKRSGAMQKDVAATTSTTSYRSQMQQKQMYLD